MRLDNPLVVRSATVGEDYMIELWEIVGGSETRDLSFGLRNGVKLQKRQ